MPVPEVTVNTSPPYFNTPLLTILNVRVGETLTLSLPGITDPDGDQTSIKIKNMNSLATLLSFTYPSLTIHPTSNAQIGVHTL
jgi:hypothetical protein